jgi:uncharacterized protein YjbJ (UPF0337 family)
MVMNKDILKGEWKELVGTIKQRWGKLTDDDISYIDGSFDKLAGQIQKHYGLSKEEVEKELEAFAYNKELHETKS